MFNHHCINLRGDVAARALTWQVAFYGTLTLLLPLAHLLQSSLPNPFSSLLSSNLSLSLSRSLFRTGLLMQRAHVLNLRETHWTSFTARNTMTCKIKNDQALTEKRIHALRAGGLIDHSTFIGSMDSLEFIWLHSRRGRRRRKCRD